MIWNMDGRGFLPNPDPLVLLPADYKNTELVFTWENLAHIVPHYLKEECLREEIIAALRKANTGYYHGFVDNFNSPKVFERIFMLLGYFAVAYVNSPEGRQKKKLPKEITIPFLRVAHYVSRHPVLDYTAYCLYNWKKVKQSDRIIDNVEPMLTFTNTDEEKLLVSTMVNMECMAGDLLPSWHNLSHVVEILSRLNELLKNMWSRIGKSFLIQFFQDFNLVYEGWEENKHSYSCDILLQSPVFASLCKYLDIRSANEYVNKHCSMFSGQRPQCHINYIHSIQPIRDSIDKKSKSLYNDCLEELTILYNNLAFRASKEEVKAVQDDLLYYKL